MLNPFRYRGYVYDEETGLYYLRSRYYNPEWGRFISADALLGKTGELLSHNLFAYCRNKPIIRYDPSGCYDWSDEGACCCSGIIFTHNINFTTTTPPQTLEDVSSTYSVWMEMQSYEEWYINSQYNVTTDISEIYLTIPDVTEKLHTCARQASLKIIGSGPRVGTQKHAAFACYVNDLSIPGLRTEASYISQAEVPYATKGSVRFDIIYINEGDPIAAWDLKTGHARLTQARITQMQSISGFDIPIYPIYEVNLK